jgi:hypothetical protein
MIRLVLPLLLLLAAPAWAGDWEVMQPDGRMFGRIQTGSWPQPGVWFTYYADLHPWADNWGNIETGGMVQLAPEQWQDGIGLFLGWRWSARPTGPVNMAVGIDHRGRVWFQLCDPWGFAERSFNFGGVR